MQQLKILFYMKIYTEVYFLYKLEDYPTTFFKIKDF